MMGICKGEGQRIRNQNGLTSEMLVEFLENSEKGRIRYNTGWDTDPSGVFIIQNLISGIQRQQESSQNQFLTTVRQLSERSAAGDTFYFGSQCDSLTKELCGDVVLEDATKDFEVLEDDEGDKNNHTRAYHFLPIDSSTTHSASPSQDEVSILHRHSISKTLPYDGNISAKFKDEKTNLPCLMASAGSLPLQNSPVGRKALISRIEGYGIRSVDGEYDDDGDCIALFTESPIHAIVKRKLDEYEHNRTAKVDDKWNAKCEAMAEFEKEQKDKLKERQILCRSKNLNEFMETNLKMELRDKEIQLELEETRRQIEQVEMDLLQKAYISHKETLDLEKKKLEAEEAERRKVEEEKEDQRRLAEDKLAKEKEQALQEEQELEKRKREKKERKAKEKLEQEKTEEELIQPRMPPKIGSSSSGDDSRVPSEFQNCIFYIDLIKYGKSQDLLASIHEKTEHIAKTSKFYNAALKVVNLPLNQISSESKPSVTYFLNLLSGKSVQIAGVSSPFSVSDERNGDLFVMNLLAFRYVKKAEAEATNNKRDNLNYLAMVGVPLVQKFPIWAELLQAHFYKACPFLVPFSYPRNGMDIRSYGKAIGHQMDFGEEKEKLEATCTQVLLERLSGYCVLYGFMVKSYTSKSHSKDEVDQFFTPREIWKILAKIVSLEPQEEVTATILHGLLEILSDLLSKFYGRQFKKLLHHIRSVYIAKIKKVTSKTKTGSMRRLELFLDNLRL